MVTLLLADSTEILSTFLLVHFVSHVTEGCVLACVRLKRLEKIEVRIRGEELAGS